MMKGVSANLPPEEVTLAAYKAGIELLLNPGKVQKSIDRIQRAIESGECSIEELDRRVRKVLHTKAEFGMLDSNYVCTIDTNNICLKVQCAEHIALSQKLSEKSMTLLSNTQQIIPLTTNKRVAYIAYNAKHIPLSREYGDIEGLSGYNPTTGMVDSTTLLYQHLLKTLSTTTQVHYFILDQNSTTEEIKQLNQQLSNYDVAILACHEPNGRSKKHLLTSQHKYALRSIVRKHHPILVHFGNPYGLSSLPWLNELGAILVAYQDSENNQIAAAKVLTGEIIAEGELPVGI
jgi:beta-N-acetylhexosaminidase